MPKRKAMAVTAKALLHAVLENVLPVRWTGPLYIERELRALGITPGVVPKECIRQLVDQDIKTAKVLATLLKKMSWRGELHLENTVASTYAILAGERDPFQRKDVAQALRAYKVIR
jgi:hypothetical protein